MSRYKLIKWYPILPENWEEGMIVGLGDSILQGYLPCTAEFTQLGILRNQVENNPDFWEKVVEKDYEILSFKSGDHIYKKRKDNRFRADAFPGVDGWIEEDFDQRGEPIHSIRRLSDNKIFSIGDKVYWDDADGAEYFTIGKLYIKSDGDLYMNTVEPFGQEFCLNNRLLYGAETMLDELKHYNEPTFVTEDGFEVKHFNFNHMWGVALQASEGDVLKKGWNKGLLDGDTPPSNRKWFWLRFKAEEYIEMNTKTYSKQDIKDAVGKVGMLGAENSPDGSSKEVILLTKKRLFEQLDI